MHVSCPPVPIPLWRPLHRRLWGRVTGALHALRARWHVSRRTRWAPTAPPALPSPPPWSRRDWDGLDELNAHTLRDIGAPDWLVLTAAERRDAAQRLGDTFGAWRGV